MNIFFVDEDPVLAAQSLVDQHVNKMVTETAQVLSNGYTLDRLSKDDVPTTKSGRSRKHSYPHHGCCKWAVFSKENWLWVVNHGLALEDERIYRGMNPHFSAIFIRWCANNTPNFDRYSFSIPYLAMPEERRCNDPVKSYRDYYNIEKYRQSTLKKKWTRRQPPKWWIH